MSALSSPFGTWTSPLPQGAELDATPVHAESPPAEPQAAVNYQAEAVADEILVVDHRARMRPSEMVERKLLSLLNGKQLPVDASLNSPVHRYIRRT